MVPPRSLSRKSLAVIGGAAFILVSGSGGEAAALGAAKPEVPGVVEDPVSSVDDVFRFLGCDHEPIVGKSNANGRLIGQEAEGKDYCAGIFVHAYYANEDADADFSYFKQAAGSDCRQSEGLSFYRIPPNVIITLHPIGETTAEGGRVHYDVEAMTSKVLQLKPTESFAVVCQ
jgi:hypothetical protein